MDTNLSQVNRAASHAVATALAPRVASASQSTSAAAKSTAAPAATSAATSSTSSSTDPSTITSSDFLTLLVGELKNQDPTQPTDPNAYITQLVGVNSLEQLISINTGITSLDSAAGAASTGKAKPVTGA
jgi:flagellar basal-body rod modification protein FlgD